MSGRVIIDIARARIQAVLVQTAKRGKAHLSERLNLLCEAVAEEEDA